MLLDLEPSHCLLIQALLESLAQLKEQCQGAALNVNQRDAVLRLLQYLCGQDGAGGEGTQVLASNNWKGKLVVLAADGR